MTGDRIGGATPTRRNCRVDEPSFHRWPIDNALAGAELYVRNQEEDNMMSLGPAASPFAALLLSFVLVLPNAVAQTGAPVRIGSTLSLTGPLAARVRHPEGGDRGLHRGPEPARRPARPQGGMGPEGRSVAPGRGAHALRAARHGRQGRPHRRAVRHRFDTLGDGRRTALQQDPGAQQLRHAAAWPSTTCSSPRPAAPAIRRSSGRTWCSARPPRHRSRRRPSPS